MKLVIFTLKRSDYSEFERKGLDTSYALSIQNFIFTTQLTLLDTGCVCIGWVLLDTVMRREYLSDRILQNFSISCMLGFKC
jgi:ABC-type microcin C transport system permease subunit YejE